MQQPVVPPNPGCRILKLHISTVGEVESATSPGLDDESLRKIASAGAHWRDGVYRHRRLTQACKELNLPPIAILQTIDKNPKMQIPVPPPLTVPFEPLPLDETDSRLAFLIDDLVLNDDDPDDSGVRRTNWFARLGFPATIVVVFTMNIIRTIVESLKTGFDLRSIAITLGLVAVILGVIGFTRWRLSTQLFLIPAGVVIRRSVWRSIGAHLVLFTPADSLLIVFPNKEGWCAQLVRQDRSPFFQRISRMEATALLAAWQSPQPTRTVEELGDLR